MKKVSIEYDGTLSESHVKDYARELISRGDVEIWITTFRCNDRDIVDGFWFDNSDMFLVLDELGISRDRVIFTNMENKSNFISKDFLWHLDDDDYVHFDMRSKSKVPSIQVKSSSFKSKCNRLLKTRE